MVHKVEPRNDIFGITSGSKFIVMQIDAIELTAENYVVFAVKAKGVNSPKRFFIVSDHPDFCNILQGDVVEIIKDDEGFVTQVNVLNV